MGLGGKYFLPCSRTLGDLLVVDSILFYPMLFFIGLAILFLFDIWTKLNCVAPRLYDAKGFAHMRSYVKRIWVLWNLSRDPCEKSLINSWWPKCGRSTLVNRQASSDKPQATSFSRIPPRAGVGFNFLFPPPPAAGVGVDPRPRRGWGKTHFG